MKKINLFIVVLIAFFSFNLTCNATARTYTRSTDNLLLPDDVSFDSSNINAILNTPAVNASEKLYDFADLIDDNKEGELVEKITEFTKESKMEVIIVTTKDLKGFQMPEYTYNFYDYNDFMDLGVTLVIYTGGKSPEIFMGNSGPKDSFIFTTFTDARINQTLSYIYNGYIKDGAYYDACDKYVEIIRGFYATDVRGIGGDNGSGSIRWVEITILSLALAFIANVLFIFQLGKHKVISKKAEVLDKRVNGSTLTIEQVKDVPSDGNYN